MLAASALMHRPASLSALVVLVALAGCLGGLAPGSGSSGSPSSPSPPAAAWADGDGVNATALAHQHYDRVRAAGSFTMNHTETVRVAGDARPDGPTPDGYHPPSTVRRQVDLDAGRYRDRFVTAGDRRSAHFVTPDVTARRRAPCPDCEYEYSFQRRPETDTTSKRIDRYRTAAAVERLDRTLRGVTIGFEYTYAGTVERDGETLHRYRAERTLDTAPPPFADPPRGTATLLVTADGVVRQFTLEYAGSAPVTVDGDRRTVEVTQTFVLRFTAVGETTVERPGWVDRAAERDPPRTTATGSG